MKTMTCKDMGGPCDAMISGNSPKQMIDNGMKHVEQAHPEMVEDIKSMGKEESEKWNDEFMKKWDETPAAM